MLARLFLGTSFSNQEEATRDTKENFIYFCRIHFDLFHMSFWISITGQHIFVTGQC